MIAASPHSISRQTASAHSAASSTFSDSRPVRETSPRTSRPNACCSRSSASRPAASSSATNISETVTATATKNELSEVVAPLTLVCLTSTGEPIVARIGLETSRLSAASRAKRATCVSATRSGASSGRVRDRRLDDRLRAAQAEDVDASRPSGSATSPPVTITSM